MDWTGVHIAFPAETFFFKTGESVIATQSAFCVHFVLHRNEAVLDRIFKP